MTVRPGPLAGKTCVVTGATSGIGLATAIALARLGGAVIGVGRDPARIAAALSLVANAASSVGAPAPRYERADFSLMREVAKLAERLGATTANIGVLVNCAGIYTARRSLSPEGLETQFAVNHLAPFFLTVSLLGSLESADSARVIVVSSGSHVPGRIHWGDPSMGRFYLGLKAYEQSKLANMLFSFELARRLGQASSVSVYTVDPGLVDTGMGQKHGLTPSSLFWRLRRRGGVAPEVPADDIAFLSSSPDVAGRTGLYWKGREPIASSRRAGDEEAGHRLWDLSEGIIAEALASNGAAR